MTLLYFLLDNVVKSSIIGLKVVITLSNYGVKVLESVVSSIKSKYPMLRTGQIIENAHAFMRSKHDLDPFYAEDYKYANMLKEYERLVIEQNGKIY